ncbi:hypothetical protein GU926_02560 [Nibribacter ruber]|uniref:Uncharacterized protein n=1 Tax=Nibribacter ruber TaxID=2698458 RepID=A0A6P1NVM4_9BACT|nr:hypothetical protein [Nibribacter ruber]QHL86384.1 hypothetical protein GU926_02560 [Nibribacter ruber]
MEDKIVVKGNIELLKSTDYILYNTTHYLSPPEVFLHAPLMLTGDNLIMNEEKSNTSDDDEQRDGQLYYEFTILEEGAATEKVLKVFYNTQEQSFRGWVEED